MYPPSLLYWLGGAALIFGLLGIIGALAWWVDARMSRWQERKGRDMGTFDDEPDDLGRAAVRLVFEALSAVFVVTGLLVCIYSDSRLARAVAGAAMVVLLSALYVSIVDRHTADVSRKGGPS